MSKSLPVAFFDDLYAASDDPWALRAAGMNAASLPARWPRYCGAFEPGCSGGVLSAGLAAQCEQLLCCDIAEEPVRAARRRLAAHANVAVRRLAVPHDWPSGPFDLVVISELAYYFDDVDRCRLWDQVAGTPQPGGTLVTVHWRHPVAEYPPPVMPFTPSWPRVLSSATSHTTGRPISCSTCTSESRRRCGRWHNAQGWCDQNRGCRPGAR